MPSAALSPARELDRGEANAIVWFVALANAPAGPMSARKVRAHRQKGQVDNSTRVWREGMADWVLLGDCRPLRELLASIEVEASTRTAARGASIVPASELAGGSVGPRVELPRAVPGDEAAFFHDPAAAEDTNNLLLTDSNMAAIQSLVPPRPGYKNQRLIMFAAVAFFVVALVTLGVVMFGGEKTGEAKTVETVEKVIERVVYRERIVEVPVAAVPKSVDDKAGKRQRGGRGGRHNAKKESNETADVRTQELMERFGMAGSLGSAPVAEKEIGRPSSDRSTTTAALTANQVQSVVNRNKNQLKTCYERALRTGEASDNRDLRVDFKLMVGSSGVVKTVTIGGEAGRLVSLQRCLRGSVKRWMFPASTKTSPVEFPFLFTPR